MHSGSAGRRSEVESALLDYHRSPGQYPLALRRPAILFSSMREVLQLASGRLPDGAAPPACAVQRAAGFFVRSALLHPGADHYALLGLERCADASAIKERYRQLMRLMHPDFATAAGGRVWPADAASRINQAYEVLASSAQRRAYDDTLDASASPGPAAAPAQRPGMQGSAHLRAAAASEPAQDPRARLKRIAGAFGALGAVALGATLLTAGQSGESLVQRAAPRHSGPVAPADANTVALVQPPAAPSPAVAAGPMDNALPAAPDALAGAPARANAESPRHTAPPVGEQRALAPPAPEVSKLATSVSGNSAQAFAAALPAPRPAAPPEPAAVQTSQASQSQPTQYIQQISQAPQPAPAPPPAPAPAALAAAPAAAKPPPAHPVSLADAHTLLSKLLQQMEAGSGERLLAGLDRSVRNTPGAQALLRQYNGLVEGARTVKVANLQLKAEPRDDSLLVTGYVALEIGEYSALRSRELPLQAEFAKRGGTVVMTRLAPGQGFAEAGRKAD